MAGRDSHTPDNRPDALHVQQSPGGSLAVGALCVLPSLPPGVMENIHFKHTRTSDKESEACKQGFYLPSAREELKSDLFYRLVESVASRVRTAGGRR